MSLNASARVPVVLYGVPFHNVTFEEAVDWIVDRVRSGKPAHIATANLDFVARAWGDPELQRILLDADLVLADGCPVVKLSSFFGPRLKERVTGSDLTPMLAARAAREGLRLYGLGGKEGVAEKAMALLKIEHPDLTVAGTFSPPFQSLLKMDHRAILRRLEKAKPDILFVALGVPKQEKFINMHVRGWNVPVSIGVGASLDYITGDQRRAPSWMRRVGLEWLWRVGREPGRLMDRYTSNFRFLLSATKKMMKLRSMSDHPVEIQPLKDEERAELERLDVYPASYEQIKTEEEALRFIEQTLKEADGRHIIMELHAEAWIDSLNLGVLLEISKACRSIGRRLMLYAVRPRVMKMLKTYRLYDYFHTVSKLDEVEALVRHLEENQSGSALYEGGSLRLELPIELTAATLPVFEKHSRIIQKELNEQEILKTVEVDARRLEFVDSSGLGFLIALKKNTQDEGVSLSITNLAPSPRKTFEIARVDRILLHT